MGQGLQDAGVNLQAKGFKEYLARLDRIDKKQREVFDQQFKGTNKSFAQVKSAARDYERQLKKTEQTQRSFGKTLASIALPAAAIAFTKQAVTVAIESAKIAAAFQGQEKGLENLAANFGQSSDAIRAAMKRASGGVLSEIAIINGANQSLLLNVARTPAEFEKITKIALTLGRTLGLTATQAIDQFNIALGRKSLLILDNFGISARAVNAEIEKLAQQQFGETARSLSQAQRDALFLEAALKVAGEAADALGEEVLESTRNFDKITAQAENLKLVFGELVLGIDTATDSSSAFGDFLEDIVGQLQGLKVTLGFGDVGDEIANIEVQMRALEKTITFNEEAVRKFDEGLQLDTGNLEFGTRLIDRLFIKLGLFDPAKGIEEAEQQFSELRDELNKLNIQRRREEIKGISRDFEELSETLEDTTEQVKQLESVLRRAEQLQLSFARAAEDTARKQTRQIDKLNRSQFKDRIKFLNKQDKEFDEFNAGEIKSVKEAEKKLNDARSKIGEDRLKDQAKLHRQLRQAEDRFNLSRFQSERRFQLDDRRLRAEGDILGLQTLREDHALSQQENQENFDLQQRQQKNNNREQEKEREQGRKEQIQALEQDLQTIQDGLDQRRQEFLIAQDKEFTDLLTAQQEQRDELERGFREQAEDRRISQARQLEDLGRSLAEQENLTAEGAATIAAELEAVFGMEGVAANIMSGFTDRTESEFRDLFEEIVGIVEETEKKLEQTSLAGRRGAGEFGLGGGAARTGRELDPFRPLAFDDGGVVPGPRGSPQAAIVHGEETILPTHKMSVPIIPSQRLDVVASGLINVQGSGSIDEAALERVGDMIADAHEEAIRRIARRG